MRSLRARLILLIIAVTGTALVAAALLSRIAVRREYLQMESSDRERSLAPVAALLDERTRRAGAAAASDSLLARLAGSLDRPLVVADSTGRVIAASSAELRAARVTHAPNGEVQFQLPSRHDGTVVMQRMRFLGLVSFPIHGGDGAVLARLYPLPRPSAPHDSSGSEPGFLLAVNRWLIAVAVGAGALAAILAATLLRRVLGPIEALTAAVRRLEAGDLAHRVPVGSGDEIGELARAFNAMAESVARNEALRRGLVSDVAHELRTPLTHLRGQIEALQDGLLPLEAGTLQSLHDETLLLSRLVDDLQELALAEAGQLPLHLSQVAVGPAIEAALAAVRAVAQERGVTLVAALPGAAADALPELRADPARLAQVLRNLLANALTHTPPGGHVTVSARVAGECVAIEVTDDGVGIAPEHLPHVFDRFYRADPSRSRASGNAGLGLAIVRQLVVAHGGTVTAESAPDAGARFTVQLPIPRPS